MHKQIDTQPKAKRLIRQTDRKEIINRHNTRNGKKNRIHLLNHYKTAVNPKAESREVISLPKRGKFTRNRYQREGI